MKAALGFALAVITGIAYLYGYDYSLTTEVFFVQGYIGALIPTVLVFMGAAIGAALNS